MTFVDVSEVFTGWTTALTGVRTTGSYVTGRWVADTPTALSFDGVVQNATPKDRETLESGDQEHEVIKIHTTTELIPADENTGAIGDLITYLSKTYRVQSCANRRIGNYYKALAVLEQ